METTGQRIKKARIAKGMTQTELADKIGVKFSAIHKYENDIVVNLKRDIIHKIADALDVRPSYILCIDDMPVDLSISNLIPFSKTHQIPLVGSIPCGKPVFAEENIQRYIDCLDTIHADFCLTCVGDSMIGARINDGDIVFIKQQPEVNNGDIAAVLINDEATLKRFYYYPDKNEVILRSENKKYPDMIYMNEELDQIRILGKAIYFTSMVD